MLKLGRVSYSFTFHIVDEETERSLCNMVALNEDAAKSTNSGAIINDTEVVASLQEMRDARLRICKHCEERYDG